MNSQNKAGYSFGLMHSLDSNLKELRRKQTLNIKSSLENIFDLDNITVARSPYPKQKQRSNSNKSIREILIEKRQNSKLIRVAKRERKLMRVKNKQENLSMEKEIKNAAIDAKHHLDNMDYNRSLSRSKMLKSGKFGITADNYSEGELEDNYPMAEESYISQDRAEEEKRKKFLNERYNIEGNRIRNVSKKITEADITPGPGNHYYFLFLIVFSKFFFLFFNFF